MAEQPHSTSSEIGAAGGANMLLQMDDVVVETVVTHVTRTRTIYPPLTIPTMLPPLPISNLPTSTYPLAAQPIPDALLSYALTLNGQRMTISQSDIDEEEEAARNLVAGAGWRKLEEEEQGFKRMNRLSAADAVSQLSHPSNNAESSSTPLGRKGGVYRARIGEDKKKEGNLANPTNRHSHLLAPPQSSPPRKRAREEPEVAIVSPDTTPEEASGVWPFLNGQDAGAADLEGQGASAQQQGGRALATLCSLPDLVGSFDALPDKLQQHVLVQLMRRVRQPSIHVISEFLLPATKRDFVGALPREVASQIISHLARPDAVAASKVCRTWKRVIDGDRKAWKDNMIDDGLWNGMDEEYEEMMIQQRWNFNDDSDRNGESIGDIDDTSSDIEMKNSTDDLESNIPASQPTSTLSERSVPLKTLYKQRYTDRKAWFDSEIVSHTQFAGLGTNVITCLQFDEDRIVCSSDDHSLNIYTLDGGLTRLDGHEGGVWALQYRGDVLVTGSTDRTVRIWDLETKKQKHVFLGHTSTVRCLQIVEPVLDEATGECQPPYPLFVTGSRDHTLRVWKLPRKGELAGKAMAKVNPSDNPFHLMCLEGHTQPVRAIATHGRICASGSYDNTVRLWDLITGACLHVLQGHDAKIYSIAIDRYRGRCISGDLSGVIHLWDIKTGTRLNTLAGHSTLVGLISVSPSLIVSAAADSSLRVWDAGTGAFRHRLGGHVAAITCFQHDETKIVSGSDGCLKLWNAQTGEFIRDLITGVSSLWQANFKDGLCVAASNRNGTKIFDVFRFGDKENESELDRVARDHSLDLKIRQPWERMEPREPLQYQQNDAAALGKVKHQPSTPPRKRVAAKASLPPRLRPRESKRR